MVCWVNTPTFIIQSDSLGRFSQAVFIFFENTINQYAPSSNNGNSGEGDNLPESAEGQPADTAIKNPDSYGTNPNAQATADGTGKSFAKPDGATYVEGTVDTGVVVNVKGSEFVWVPVDDVVIRYK